MYRMSSTLFNKIVNNILSYDVEPIPEYFTYFRQRYDATGRKSIGPILKCTSVIHQLAYDTAPDAFDEYLQIAERTSRECLDNFTKCIHVLYVEKFLRKPTAEDIQKTYELHEQKHELPRMLRSIDYDELADIAPECPFVVNGHTYRKGYYLADSIYPAWSTFIKTFSIARDEKTLKFKRVQESARKDIERAFGYESYFNFIRFCHDASERIAMGHALDLHVYFGDAGSRDSRDMIIIKHTLYGTRNFELKTATSLQLPYDVLAQELSNAASTSVRVYTGRALYPNGSYGSGRAYYINPKEDKTLDSIKKDNSSNCWIITSTYATSLSRELRSDVSKDYQHPRQRLGIDHDPNEDRIVKGNEVEDGDLSKPFKETLRTPFTRRIIEFSGPEYSMLTNIALYDGSTDPADHLNHFVGATNSREWPMPVWCRMFQQTLDGSARGWFESLSPNSIDEWWKLREAFTARYSTRKACYKEPHEITKIVRKANETLTAFKERWTMETRFIMGVPEVMKISSFMDSVKSPELSKRFASNVPKTVDEMMKRLDEFVRAEEAYALAELPLRESRYIHRRLSFPAGSRDIHQRLTFPDSIRDDRNGRNSQGKDFQKGDYRNSYKAKDNFNTGRHRDYRAPYLQREQANRTVPLPPPRPVANPLRTGDPDKYCDYHQDKGHHTNDCIQLRKQLEITLELGKLNHLMKDLRQRVERRQNINPPAPKVINMVDVHYSKKKKQKDREIMKSWMNTPISFPPIMTDDASDEPLIIEAEIEGYLVRRVYVDEGSSVEVMGGSKTLGKIDLEVCFGNEGLSRRTSMKFIVVRAPSPYNVILGRPGLKILHDIPSTIHSMIKFPTPKGIATLIARTTIIVECRLREEKQVVWEETLQEEEGVDATEQIIVNLSFPDQIVTIGGRLSKDCKDQLKTLLKGSMEVFAWEPADMTGVPRKIIEHALNVNPSFDPVCQKRRTFSPEKSEISLLHEQGGNVLLYEDAVRLERSHGHLSGDWLDSTFKTDRKRTLEIRSDMVSKVKGGEKSLGWIKQDIWKA
ncbi:reverse transcriptase domain-containing protein [Tanacetum coccineum]|uniref:Reverse transcriptase domain-containing protein n=1 Tax=Tanacetum coccineum TaxID=301880 RepID=A0ABQ5IZF1_9ASTR